MKTYVEKRQIVIDRVLELTKRIYTDSKEMLSGVIGLTVELKAAEQSDDFVHGMLGFLSWCDVRPEIREGFILNTLIHDLGEFSRDRNEDWFSPRTYGYIKFALEYAD